MSLITFDPVSGDREWEGTWWVPGHGGPPNGDKIEATVAIYAYSWKETVISVNVRPSMSNSYYLGATVGGHPIDCGGTYPVLYEQWHSVAGYVAG
jgi:hypothetical protein